MIIAQLVIRSSQHFGLLGPSDAEDVTRAPERSSGDGGIRSFAVEPLIRDKLAEKRRIQPSRQLAGQGMAQSPCLGRITISAPRRSHLFASKMSWSPSRGPSDRCDGTRGKWVHVGSASLGFSSRVRSCCDHGKH